MGLKESGLRGSLRNVSVGIDEIPDSVVAQYDATEEPSTGSVTSIDDLIGSLNLSGDCSVISNGINDLQTYRFDGSQRMLVSELIAETPDDEPFAFAFVAQQQESTGSGNVYLDGGDTVEFAIEDRDGDEIRIYRGGGWDGDPTDSATNDPHLFVLEGYDDNRIRLERDGEEVVDRSNDSLDLTGITLGGRADDSDPRSIEIDFGQIEILVGFSQDDINAVKERLQEKWDTPDID